MYPRVKTCWRRAGAELINYVMPARLCSRFPVAGIPPNAHRSELRTIAVATAYSATFIPTS